MNELGTYIREKRTEKGLSIRRLAELADISHTEVKRIEDGLRKQTSPQVLRSIASALGVPYEELMAAAGYIDESAAESSGGTVAAGIKGQSVYRFLEKPAQRLKKNEVHLQKENTSLSFFKYEQEDGQAALPESGSELHS